jgi:aminoglycoside 6'-N-acetyltransferase I
VGVNSMLEFKKFENSYLDECTNLFLNVYSVEPWNDKWESFEQARDYLLEFISNPVFSGYIACNDSKIIGVCLGHKRSWWSGKSYYMNEFFVDNDLQGQGIGTQFMNYIKKNLIEQGIKGIVLITEKDIPAEMFYKKNNFQVSQSNIFMVCNRL